MKRVPQLLLLCSINQEPQATRGSAFAKVVAKLEELEKRIAEFESTFADRMSRWKRWSKKTLLNQWIWFDSLMITALNCGTGLIHPGLVANVMLPVQVCRSFWTSMDVSRAPLYLYCLVIGILVSSGHPWGRLLLLDKLSSAWVYCLDALF